MKNKFTLVYTIFASIIFAFSISFLAFNLYKEYTYGPARTSGTFNSIVSDVRNKSKTSSPEEIIGYLHKRFDRYNDFAYIKITFNEKELLKFPANASEGSSSSNLSKKFKSSISTDQGNFYIDCDMYLLRPYSIFYYAKISFLIILIITIITVILIVYLNMNSEKNSEVINYTEENISTDEPVLNEINTNVTTEINNETSEIKTESEVTENQESETSTSHTQSPTEADIVTVENVELPSEKVELPSEEEKPSNIENPEGLFNPITGFGWEQYLLTRLDSELNRAIASEFDLALFIINFPGIDKDSELFIQSLKKKNSPGDYCMVILYLPVDFNPETFSIKTISGFISLKDFSSENDIELFSQTGNIDIIKTKSTFLSVNSISGNIIAKNISCDYFSFSTIFFPLL